MCHNPQVNRSGCIYSCGKCKQCHDKYIRQWVFRLQRQQYSTPDCLFITLTYDYGHIPMNKGKFTLQKSGENGYQNFLKRLRKAMPNRELKYVLCGEYGSKQGRPHYHAIMFNVSMDDYSIIKTAWGMGHVHVGSVTPASIAYTFKYAVKGDIKERDWRQLKPFIAMSKGIGDDFAFTVVGNTVTKGRSEWVNKKTGEVKERDWVRYAKIKVPKPHFQKKLDTLLQMPYYTIPSQNGGTVKMSIPKYYLRTANYDTAQLGELYSDVIQKKYSMLSNEKKDAIFKRQEVQRKYAVLQQTQERLYSITKEKM